MVQPEVEQRVVHDVILDQGIVTVRGMIRTELEGFLGLVGVDAVLQFERCCSNEDLIAPLFDLTRT